MSHASVIVAVDVVNPHDRHEIEAAVAFQMAPYDEKDEFFRDGSRWDWYTIGGRFSGALDDYDPEKDRRNVEVCTWCGGTGTRTDMVVANGCNSCNGTGIARKFRNAPHPGDILQVKQLKRPVHAYAFLRERHWHEPERMGWWGCPARTECEIKSQDDPDVLVRRCLTVGDENARIVTWNEPYEVWEKEFHARFIEKLPPETVLALVDYHV